MVVPLTDKPVSIKFLSQHNVTSKMEFAKCNLCQLSVHIQSILKQSNLHFGENDKSDKYSITEKLNCLFNRKIKWFIVFFLTVWACIMSQINMIYL